jgi:hypothetical protein
VLNKDWKGKEFDLTSANKFKNSKKAGDVGEEWVDKRLNSRVEVKTELDVNDINWRTSGNIIIEINGYKGRKSGLSITEADTWVQVLTVNGKPLVSIMFEVDTLKKLMRKYWNELQVVQGGDGNYSRIIKLPLKKLFEMTL